MQTTCSSVVGLRAFANNCGIPIAAVLDVKPFQDMPQVVRAPSPPRCRNCRAFWSQYCMVNLPRQMWHCACCGVGNISKSALANPDPTVYPELYNDTVEYRVPRQEEQPLPRASKHIVVVVDATMDAELLASCKSALLTVFQKELDLGTLVSVIAFDGAVAVFDMANDRQPVSSTVLPGSISLNKAAGHDVLGRPGAFSAEYGHCADRLAAVLSSIRPYEAGKPMRLRSRSTTVAIEAGLELLSKSAALCPSDGAGGDSQLASGSRLLVFVGGPITKGPGCLPLDFVDGLDKPTKVHQKLMKDSQAHMASLASSAGKMGAAIDLFLGTTAGMNIPLLHQMVEGSRGGRLHAQRGFGRSLAPALRACLSSCIGTRGTMDVFCSDGLRLAQCMGALDEQQKLGAPASPPGPWLSPSACYVGDLVVGRGVVARFELQHDLPCSEPSRSSFAHIQVVLYYHDSHTHELVARVSSKRLEVVSRASQFLRSVDAPMAAVVAAKRLALDAQGMHALEGDSKKLEGARLGVSAQVALIAARLGREVQVSSGLLGLGARKEKQWPPELLLLAQGLYNLQRGPMLADPSMLPHAVHPDERLLSMLQLLAAGSAPAVAQVLPTLYAVLPEQQGAAGVVGREPGQPGPAPPSPAADKQAAASKGTGPQAGGGMQLALVELGAPPLNVVGMAALHIIHAGPSANQPSVPPLLLDAGPTQLLLPPPAKHADAAAEVALEAAARDNRTPQLLVVQAPSLAELAPPPPTPGTASVEQGPGCAHASEAEFLAALQPAHTDTWVQQQAQLDQSGKGTWAWMIIQGRDEAHVAALSAAAARHLQGASCPSFLQWGKGMGILFLPQ